MLQITFDGYIGSDSRFFPASGSDGMGFVRFSLCTKQRSSNNSESLLTDVWFDCFLPRRTDTLCQHLTKGKRLLVSGQLQISQYTTRAGEVRPSFTVHVSDFSFLDRKPDTDASPES